MAERNCPACKMALEPANIVDHEDGTVEFQCARCDVALTDNATRTDLKVKSGKKGKKPA